MATTETAPAQAPPAKGGKMTLILLVVVGLVAVGAGIFVPKLLFSGGDIPKAAGHGRSGKQGYVSFGDVIVNIHEERMTRFLRIKIILVVDEEEEKKLQEELPKKKALMKNWAIGYLCDRSIAEVRGAAAVNRLRREILDQFNAIYDPEGSQPIRDILFEEFVVQ